MLDILIDLLTPVFVSMGASAADVANYVRAAGGYVYAILGILAAVAAVMIAAQFAVKKGTRHVVRWSAALAGLLAVVLVVNLVCFGPMYAMVSGVLNASKAEISDDVVANSLAVVQETGEEGMVLLKNDGLLPLSSDVSALNVFGWASAHPVFSGTGSAASGDASIPQTDIITSLNEAGFATNEELTKMYADYGKDYWGGNRPVISMTAQDWSLPEPTAEYYTAGIMSSAEAFSDTAVIVIGRSGGENADLPSDMKAVIDGTFDVAATDAVQQSVSHNYNSTRATFYNNTREYDEFGEGDHYLQLSQSEKNLVDTVCSSFDKVIVVINANNVMELGWVEDYQQIGAVILAPGTGASGMKALGRILNGTVNPSGKTVDTYLYDLKSAPTWNHAGNSGNHLYTNVGDLTKQLARIDNTFNGVISFTDYVEGIYMGYKFYETAAEEDLIDFEQTVQYPFGYGLSYTSFTQEIASFDQSGDEVKVDVTVTNTGSAAGKDVVELYYTPPYTNGGIEKASVNLIDFAKTGLLEPGASETVSFRIPLEDMASYDSSCIKTAAGGYVLEAGEYAVSIRSDSHTVIDERTFTLGADKDYSSSGRSSDHSAPVNRFDYMNSSHPTLSRKDGFANYDAAAAAPGAEEFELTKEQQNVIREISVVKYDPADYDDPNDVMPTTGAKGSLTLADLAGKDYGDASWEKLLDQMSIEDMTTLINTGGWQTAAIESVGKMATSDCDGPSGLSNYVTGSNGTQFPTEVLMAQTWSKEMAEKIGDALGQEFANANNYGWYGPAMNLHRTAFSGRNFEYYSEDPVLSGLFASQEVNGAAKYGVYSYIKHFAANDQETNRTAFLLTYMTEQTFRETCLKPFEMVVKNFDFERYVMGMMTAYNWLGTVPAISSSELLNDVLRGEWGFQGMVISDYNGSYGFEITDAAIRAGNDLMLGYGMAENNKLEDTDSATCVLAMRQACKNILYTVANSGYYADEAAAQGGMSGMTRLFIMADAAAVVLALGIEALVVLRWMKKRRESASK